LIFLLAGSAFPQTDELLQRGSIPEELLRPRREEAPRYPVDTVIGPIGQGKASTEAYNCARRAAAAFLAGNMNAPVFSYANKGFLEDCINALNVVNPRYFRLGSGREEPDGSVSFLVRFAGREQGITGELFVRFEERVTNPQPPTPPVAPPPASSPVTEDEDEEASEPVPGEDSDSVAVEAEQAPPVYVPIIEKIWVFEDMILETPRSREEETLENRQRYDFSPYERFF
jgi:hypothetical protein